MVVGSNPTGSTLAFFDVQQIMISETLLISYDIVSHIIGRKRIVIIQNFNEYVSEQNMFQSTAQCKFLMVCAQSVCMACKLCSGNNLDNQITSLGRRAVGSNMVLSGCFLHGIRICRLTTAQIKAGYYRG